MSAQLEELYQRLNETERAIVDTAISDIDRARGFSVFCLYFPGHSETELRAFLNAKKRTRI